jgi:hypothetical protein
LRGGIKGDMGGVVACVLMRWRMCYTIFLLRLLLTFCYGLLACVCPFTYWSCDLLRLVILSVLSCDPYTSR